MPRFAGSHSLEPLDSALTAEAAPSASHSVRHVARPVHRGGTLIRPLGKPPTRILGESPRAGRKPCGALMLEGMSRQGNALTYSLLAGERGPDLRAHVLLALEHA